MPRNLPQVRPPSKLPTEEASQISGRRRIKPAIPFIATSTLLEFLLLGRPRPQRH